MSLRGPAQPLRPSARSARVVGVGNGAGGVRFTGGNPPKKKPENVLFTDGMDGMDGISKVSFNFLHALWLYRTCIYLLIYINSKIVTSILMGFKILCQAGGRGQKYENYVR